MTNLSHTHSTRLPWSHWLASLAKTVSGTLRQPQASAIAHTVAESQPVQLILRAFLPPEHATVVCVMVEGELNRHTYTCLIDAVSAHYRQGRCTLLLDLSQTIQIELSGRFALLSIARLYSGQPLLDPEAGWAGLRAAAEAVTPALGERVKLIAPSPAATDALARASFCRFFTCYPDLDTAMSTIGQ